MERIPFELEHVLGKIFVKLMVFLCDIGWARTLRRGQGMFALFFALDWDSNAV